MVGYLVLMLGGLLFGAIFYRYDMHEREPWWMLVCAVIAGAGLMALAFVLEGTIESQLVDAKTDPAVYRLVKSLLAGTIEELAKLAVPLLVMLLIRKHFNDPMDGLIYGSMAGLGAALYESLWWAWFVPTEEGTLLLHAQGPNAMRLLMHTVWGGIGGFALGLRIMKKPWRLATLRNVGLVMAIHFAWDFFIGFVSEQTTWHRLAAAALIAVSVIWFGLIVIKANKWSRAMHAPTSKQKLVGRIVRAVITRRIR